MRRSEIIDGVNEVLDAISSSEIVAAIESRMKQLHGGEGTTKSGIPVELLTSLQEWSTQASEFSPAGQHVANVLGMSLLGEPRVGAAMLGPVQEAYNTLTRMHQRLKFAMLHLPSLLSMLYNASTDDEYRGGANDGNAESAKFSVIIVDDSDGFVTPSRMINVIESTEKLYEICAILNNSSETQLRILAADSGSDLLLTFLGDATAVACALKVFATIYRAVLFYPEIKRAERAKAVAQQLPVFAEIGDMEAEGKIPHDTAERLRHDLAVGVDKHISAHAYVLEADNTGIPSVRALVAPETKLLTGSTDVKTPDANEQDDAGKTQKPALRKKKGSPGRKTASQEPAPLNNLSPEEQKQYDQLAAKMQSAKATDVETNEDDPFGIGVDF